MTLDFCPELLVKCNDEVKSNGEDSGECSEFEEQIRSPFSNMLKFMCQSNRGV